MTQIKLRRDTAANFTSKNPVLGVGEPAYETDTKKLKIGDGTTAYTKLEYFSAGGSTNISATLPLKIVDGVISLEVDGQTIQIVDGKLHANLDELSNTVNTLSGDVEVLFDDLYQTQADVQSNIESITNLQTALSKKEDKITAVAPIYKATKSKSPLKGFSHTADNNGIYSTDGWGTSFDNGEEGHITVGSEYGGDISFPFTVESLKCYISIPFGVGSILKYPNFNTNNNAVLLGYFNSDDTFIPVTNLYFCAGPTGIVPNNPSITTQYAGKQFQLQNSIKNPAAVSATRWTPSNASNISYTQLYQNTDGSIGWSGSASNVSGTERYSYYKESYYITQDEIEAIKKITTAIIVPFHYARNADYQYGTSTANAYPIASFGVYKESRLMGRDFTDLAELTDNQFSIDTPQVSNSLGLNIGSGLSVVDGKLTADTVTVDAYTKEQTNALLNTKQDKIVTLTKEAYDALTEKDPNTIYMIEGETQDAGGDKVTVLSNEYTTISPAPTNGVWYKSSGNGYIVARFMSSAGNQFCQLAINATGTGTLDDNSIYNQTAFSQGGNNGFTLLLPISSTQYYAVNTNFGKGLQWARFIPFITV